MDWLADELEKKQGKEKKGEEREMDMGTCLLRSGSLNLSLSLDARDWSVELWYWD